MRTKPSKKSRSASPILPTRPSFVPFPYSILTTQIVAEQWEQFTLSDLNNYNKIQNGLNVAIGILNLSYEGNMADETPIFMRTVVGKLGFFLQLLKTPQDSDRFFQMTYGRLSPPFGFLRVKILEFLSALLSTRYQSVVDSFWKTEPNVFETLLDILFHYKWNNTVHYYIDQIVATIMSLDNGDNIIAVLIEKCKFIERFGDAFKKESDRTVGYLGHLVHLSNELTKASTYHEPLAKLLEENDLWKELVNGRLKEINDRNNTPIGAPPAGGSPMMGDSGLGEMGRGAESVFYEEQGVQYEEDGSDEEVDEEGIELVDENERPQEVELTPEEPVPSGEEAAASS